MTMLSVAGIEVGSTLMWLCIGIVCAIVCAMFVGGRRMLLYDMIIGVAASIAGGWGSSVALGDASRLQFIIAALTALLFSGAALVIFNYLSRSKMS